MPSWLWPAVKMILPHVGDIVKAAKPAFTKKAADPVEQPDIVQQQIAELQAAASDNAAQVRELAEQLRLTVTALEQAAAEMQKRLRRANAIAITSLLAACAALGVALYAALY
jgi:hypothetical protein